MKNVGRKLVKFISGRLTEMFRKTSKCFLKYEFNSNCFKMSMLFKASNPLYPAPEGAKFLRQLTIFGDDAKYFSIINTWFVMSPKGVKHNLKSCSIE